MPYDKQMLIVRTIWVLLHITTCLFIIIGNGSFEDWSYCNNELKDYLNAINYTKEKLLDSEDEIWDEICTIYCE